VNVSKNELCKIGTTHVSHLSNYDISNYIIQQRHIELSEIVDSSDNIKKYKKNYRVTIYRMRVTIANSRDSISKCVVYSNDISNCRK